MKRKRNIGYNRDELLTETTSLNLMYNRTFDLDHNIHIYSIAKDMGVENIYTLNQHLKTIINEGKYYTLEDIKQFLLYK
jgi:hypothetical protein